MALPLDEAIAQRLREQRMQTVLLEQ